MQTNKLSPLILGLALFSMFFGSGNLIYPLYVGQVAQDQSFFATAGFLLSAVLLPFSGVVAMVYYKGDYQNFFSSIGKYPGFLLTLILLTVWIPLGSSPRCIALAYQSLSANLSLPPLWLFSIAYCLLVWLVVYRRNRMLDILGRFLTPLLLACLALIVFKGLFWEELPSAGVGIQQAGEMFKLAAKEGYNTMDLIAAFFFSASIINILRKQHAEESHPLKLTVQSCVVGMIILGIVYVGLIQLSAFHAPLLEEVSKDQLLAHLAKNILGSQLGILAAVAILLACFTTSVALVVVFVDFLNKSIFRTDRDRGHPLAIPATLIASFLMSISGLEGISAVTGPVLQVCYPLLAILIVFNVSRLVLTKSKSPAAVPVPSESSS